MRPTRRPPNEAKAYQLSRFSERKKLLPGRLGRMRGGPGLTAALSSTMLGTINGSAVANVVTTGTFTIPLMKRAGYSATLAGAIEAAASSAGQILPPVMGAAAFLMAEIIGVPYATIALAALIPGLLYVLALMIAVWHILPALRTGNTVVSKPSPNTPLSTLRMVELMNEVLPAGVVNCVSSSDTGDNIGAAMSAHPGIRKLVFTGSCATGQKVMMSAAETMKRLTLELGGNDAGIILGDVNVDEIAEGLFWGAFINNGQTCASMKRAYVHEDVYDDVCEALAAYTKNVPVGDGLDENSALGPVQNQMQFDKVARLVNAAKSKGTVLTGGEPGEGLFYNPTLIAGLENGDALFDEEQFGPALPIIKFSDEKEAMAAANDSNNGLGGSIWTRDIEKARTMAGSMECGTVWINGHAEVLPHAPFGGCKMSGFGVEFGQEGLLEYTVPQTLNINK